MNIEVPFQYAVSYKEPGKPSFKSADVSDKVDIEIAEIDAVLAPVVHVLSDATLSGPRRREYGERRDEVSRFHVPGGDCHIRYHDGQYWASRYPVADIARLRGDGEFDAFKAEVERPIEGGFGRTQRLSTDYALRGGHGRQVRETFDGFSRQNPDAKKVTTSRGEVEDLMRMVADEFAVIDGVLYEKVFEPVLSVVVDAVAKTVSIVAEEVISPEVRTVSKGRWRGDADERTRFGLDQRGEAFAFAQARARHLGFGIADYVDVKQVDPTSVRFRGEHEYLAMAARVLTEKARSAIRYLPDAQAMAVAEASTLLATHDRLTPAGLRAVRELEARMREYTQGAEFGGIFEGERFSGGMARFALGEEFAFVAERLTDALGHWDARIDVGVEWLDRAVDAMPVYDYPRRAFEITSAIDIDKLAMRWDGPVPMEVAMFDPRVSALVVVEDYAVRSPLAVMVYPRNDYAAAPKAFGNGGEAVSVHLALAKAFVSGDRGLAMKALGRADTIEPAAVAYR